MTKQLLLCKRLFSEGSFYADRTDSISSGISISLFQDAVEMYVWTLIKEKNIIIKDGASFTSNLEVVQKTGIQLPQAAKLIELNKARVGFKHYGNLPDSTEVTKYQTTLASLLKVPLQEYTYLSSVLHTAHKRGDGNWETMSFGFPKYDEAMCKRILTC